MKMKIYFKLFALFYFCVLFVQPVLSEEALHYDRINFSVDAVAEVENDIFVAVMFAQEEGDELSELSDTVNRTIKQAITKAKTAPGNKVETLAYESIPVYQKQRLIGWRVKQSIRLESHSIKVLSKLIASLQASLALESVRYNLSREGQSKVEKQLVAEALGLFKERALQIAQNIGRESYRLVTLDIRTPSNGVLPVSRRSMAMAMEARVAQPVFEPGFQKIVVSVSGTIELEVK